MERPSIRRVRRDPEAGEREVLPSADADDAYLERVWADDYVLTRYYRTRPEEFIRKLTEADDAVAVKDLEAEREAYLRSVPVDKVVDDDLAFGSSHEVMENMRHFRMGLLDYRVDYFGARMGVNPNGNGNVTIIGIPNWREKWGAKLVALIDSLFKEYEVEP